MTVQVALFTTCLADQLYPEVAASTVRVLERLGCTVSCPSQQVCCGQPAFNTGYFEEAQRVAQTLLDCFEHADYVVSPSGSCVGMIRHNFGRLFAKDEKRREQAERLSRKIREFSQFLVHELAVVDVGASFPHRVTYHPSCHATRLLGVVDEPLRLIQAVRDLELAELPRAEDCCGFGGLFSVKLGRVSTAIVDEKVDHVVETGAHYLVGTDMGCLMNIEGRMRTRGLDVRALHLAELLDSVKATELR